MTAETIRGHLLTLTACVLGIAGIGMMFQGVMDGSLHTFSRGVPLLLLGLWWASRELGRSIAASHTGGKREQRLRNTKRQLQPYQGAHSSDLPDHM